MPTIVTRGAASAKSFGFTNASSNKPVLFGQIYTSGVYTWIAPAGVTSVSVVGVGGGGGTGGVYGGAGSGGGAGGCK